MSDPANVVVLNVDSTLDIPPERVLKGALAAELTEVLIIGYRKDGTEYIASSESDGRTILWLCELAKHRLMSNAPTSAPPPTGEGAVLQFPKRDPET